MEINKIIVFVLIISFIICILLQIDSFRKSLRHYSCGPGPALQYQYNSIFWGLLKDIILGLFMVTFSHAISPIDIYFMVIIIAVPIIIDMLRLINFLLM